MATDLENALVVLTRPRLTLADFEAMRADQMNVIRMESENHRGVCKLWLAEARRVHTRTGTLRDPVTFHRVEMAEQWHGERIRHAHLVCANRKAARPAPNQLPSHEPDAQEACRRLAAEVERLQSELVEAKKVRADARLHQAFFEAAKFILAESTFNRMLAKAKELAK